MEVTHQNGFSRFCNSIITALCLAPLIIFGMVILLGWNEKRAVCEMRAMVQGEQEVKEIGCTNPNEGNGNLVMFKCDVSQSGLVPKTFPGSDFTFNYVGPLQVTGEMLQCVEHARSETQKDSVGGGTTTYTYYTYSVEWQSSYINSGNFKGKYPVTVSGQPNTWASVCGAENPQWPPGMPSPGRYDPPGDIMAGPYTLSEGLKTWLSLTATVAPKTVAAGWSSSGQYYIRQSLAPRNIGDARVSFKGYDWSQPKVTVLGKNSNGIVGGWTAKDSWLCSGFKLLGLEQGSTAKAKFFENMQAKSTAVTYVLRIVGFILMWCAFKCFFGPIGVVADCIPCIGPCLGDAVETIACIISCPPACACALGVIGIVWVAMRPAAGIPLMIIFCCVMGGMVGYSIYARKKRQGSDGGGGGNEP